MSISRMNTFWCILSLPTLVALLFSYDRACQELSIGTVGYAQSARDPKTRRDTWLPAQTVLSLSPRTGGGQDSTVRTRYVKNRLLRTVFSLDASLCLDASLDASLNASLNADSLTTLKILITHHDHFHFVSSSNNGRLAMIGISKGH
jgi:hypothetical protein